MGKCHGLTSTWVLSGHYCRMSRPKWSPVSVSPEKDAGQGRVRENDPGGY